MSYNKAMNPFETATHLQEQWPELSWQAWQALMADLPEANAIRQETSGFLIQSLPDAEKLWGCLDDAWVFAYERAQAQLLKRGRRQGQVQNGVFYTPPPLAAYLAQQTLGVFLAERLVQLEQAVLRQDQVQVDQLIQTVRGLKIMDPACGTGVFLLAALRLLSAFYQQAQSWTAPEIDGDFNGAHFAYYNQLYGIDLDPLSVAITEFRLAQWARCFQLPVSQSLRHFVTADTLQDRPFPEQKWHFVLGNPPYVSEVRGQAGRFRALPTNSLYYQSKMDLCDAFTAWAVVHLEPGGELAYVLPEYWLQRTSSAPLRDRLWQAGNAKEIWTFGAKPVFKAAPGHHTMLLIWQQQEQEKRPSKLEAQSVLWGQCDSEVGLQAGLLRQAVLSRSVTSGKFVLGVADDTALLQRLSSQGPLLRADEIQQGIVLPQGRLKKTDWHKLSPELQQQLAVDAGIFLLNAQEVQTLCLEAAERALLKPYYGPAGFLPFQGFAGRKPDYTLIYTDLAARQQMQQNPQQFARLKAHLDAFSPILTSAFRPYGLHRPRQQRWFESGPKLLCPRQVMVPSFALITTPAYVSEGFYVIRLSETSIEDSVFLTAVLNSRLAWFWFYHQKRKGHRLQLDKDVLIHFPRPEAQTPAVQVQLSDLANQLAQLDLEAAERLALVERLNVLVYVLYGLTQNEIERIEQTWRDVMSAPE